MRNNPVDHDTLRRLYREGLTFEQLAEALECGVSAIRRNLQQLGLYEKRKGTPRRPLKRMFTKKHAEDLLSGTFVDRDPCGFCGVRGDIGCVHNRRAA